MSEIHVAAQFNSRTDPYGNPLNPDGTARITPADVTMMPTDFGPTTTDAETNAAVSKLLQWQFDHPYMTRAISIDGVPHGQAGKEPSVRYLTGTGRLALAPDSVPAAVTPPTVTPALEWVSLPKYIERIPFPKMGQWKFETRMFGEGGYEYQFDVPADHPPSLGHWSFEEAPHSISIERRLDVVVRGTNVLPNNQGNYVSFSIGGKDTAAPVQLAAGDSVRLIYTAPGLRETGYPNAIGRLDFYTGYVYPEYR